MRLSTALGMTIGILISAAAGCGNSSDVSRPEVFPVSGLVLIGGKPAAGVTVNFHPQTASSGAPLVPSATTEADGTFHLRTFAPADGAPQGDYVVTASWWTHSDGGDDAQPIDRLRGRYSNLTQSQLKAHVAAGPNELSPFVLK